MPVRESEVQIAAINTHACALAQIVRAGGFLVVIGSRFGSVNRCVAVICRIGLVLGCGTRDGRVRTSHDTLLKGDRVTKNHPDANKYKRQ